MRTVAPVMIVLVLGVSGSMLSMAGFAGAWGVAEGPSVGGASERIQDQADNINPEEGAATGPVSSDESSLIGMVVDTSQSITRIAAGILLLPMTLTDLGFPEWFAVPVSLIAYIVTTVGIMQFTTNRVWK